jgi:hypothetical protein
MVDNANAAMTTAEQVQSSTFKLANERTEAMLRLQKELLDMYDQRAAIGWPSSSRKQSYGAGLLRSSPGRARYRTP